MKIEQLIVQQLYNTKNVTLQDIGTFILSPDVAIPFENDKDSVMPLNAISFEYNKKALQDDELISFIVSQTRKIKSLATSDLESYTLLAKQFLNIGKPFPIEGLGILQKTQEGNIEFSQGHSINAKLESAPAILKEKNKEEISFSTQPRESSGKKWWIWVALFFIIAATTATIYYFLKNDNKESLVVPVNKTVSDTIDVTKDTVVLPLPVMNDTLKKNVPESVPAVNNLKIVINEHFTKESADKAFARITSFGHKVVIIKKDSAGYKIIMPFTRPLSDTMLIKDSLRQYFKAKTYVEKN